jgi:hypothetical protein
MVNFRKSEVWEGFFRFSPTWGQQQIQSQVRGKVAARYDAGGVAEKILFYSGRTDLQTVPFPHGAVAQLIERVVRNDEVVGLIPICSTTFGPASFRMRDCFLPPSRAPLALSR